MSIPKYAQQISENKRVKYFCKGSCSSGRYGELNMTKNEADKLLKQVQSDPTDTHLPKIEVTCLKCGQTQADFYNWVPEFRG